EVAAPVALHPDLAGALTAVPPDLEARRGGAAEEVADGEVLDIDVVGLVRDDAVSADRIAAGVGRAVALVLGRRVAGRGGAGLVAVDDGGVAVHPSDVQP